MFQFYIAVHLIVPLNQICLVFLMLMFENQKISSMKNGRA